MSSSCPDSPQTSTRASTACRAVLRLMIGSVWTGLFLLGGETRAQDAVVVDSDRRLHAVDLATGTPSPILREPVHAALQDAAGNWWLVLEREEELHLLWLPMSLQMADHIEISRAVPIGTDKVQVRLGPESTVEILGIKARRENARECGDWSDTYLCTEALGWREPSRWQIEIDPTALGIPIPRPRAPLPTQAGTRPEAMSQLECTCWEEPVDCGKTVQFGAWELMLVDVECGDLYHPSCVLYDRSSTRYASSNLSSMTQGVDWKTGADTSIHSYCGPFLMSPSGARVTDGKGTDCTLDPDQFGCISAASDFLGIRGESWTQIHLR